MIGSISKHATRVLQYIRQNDWKGFSMLCERPRLDSRAWLAMSDGNSALCWYQFWPFYMMLRKVICGNFIALPRVRN
jgi:hypothetical protein